MVARRVLGSVLLGCLRALWWALVIALPLLGVWLASSLASYLNGPRWLAVAAGVALFPGLPVLWDRVAEWRRGRRAARDKRVADKPRVLTTGDRLVLRTLAINLSFLALLCAWYPAQAFAALATRGDWFVEGQSPERVRQVRAFASTAAGGLEFLYAAAHDNPFRQETTDDPLSEAPTAGSSLPATPQASLGASASPVPSAPQPEQAPSPTPDLPKPEPPKSELPTPEPPTAEEPKTEPPKSELPTPEPPKPEQPKAEPTLQISYPFAAQLHPLVRDMPRDAEASIQSVAEYIAAREAEPFLRVKALHDYVASRIAYDGEGYVAGNYASSEPEQVFSSRKAVCGGYARLLAALGKVTGDEIRYVPGDARVGAAGLTGQGHAWNAAKIRGAWYLVDATWDAGYLDGSSFIRSYRTDYLFAPPEVMGVTHFPDAEVWQLRAPALSRAEFLQQPVLRPWFFSNGLELLDPRSAQVTVRDQRFAARIANPNRRFITATADPAAGGRAVRCQVTPGGSVLVTCALPRGKYKVNLFAAAQESGSYPFAGEFEVFSN